MRTNHVKQKLNDGGASIGTFMFEFNTSGIDDGKSLLDQGFRMLAYGGDLWLYQSAVRHGVAALNQHTQR